MTRADTHEVVSRVGLSRLQGRFSGRCVIVTGARGFLGRGFCAVLSAAGARVWALDRFDLAGKLGAAPPLDLPGVEYRDHDVTLPFEANGRVNEIISLAAIASPHHYNQMPLACAEVILLGTRNMLDLAERTGAGFFLSSTSELYGDPLVTPTPEGALGRLDPWSARGMAYDVPKLCAEALTAIYSRRGVKARVVRYFNVYGPPLPAADYRVMSRFAAASVNKKAFVLYGYGHQSRTFCYVTDALVGSFLVLLGGDDRPYNVGNDVPEVSIRALAEMFCAVGGENLIVTRSPPTPYVQEPRRRCPDLTRLKSLGYKPTVDLKEGVTRFLAWAREEPGYLQAS